MQPMKTLKPEEVTCFRLFLLLVRCGPFNNTICKFGAAASSRKYVSGSNNVTVCFGFFVKLGLFLTLIVITCTYTKGSVNQLIEGFIFKITANWEREVNFKKAYSFTINSHLKYKFAY